MSAPCLRARCQKWTICSVPGGRFALIFFRCLGASLLAAQISARHFDKKEVFVLCDICRLSASLSVCYLVVACEMQANVHVVCTAGEPNITLQAVSADHIPLRVIVLP